MSFKFPKGRVPPRRRHYWLVVGATGFAQEVDDENRARAIIKELKAPCQLLKVEVMEKHE